MYQRPDGLYEKLKIINGKKKAFRGRSPREVENKMIEYAAEMNQGRLFKDVADEWEREHFKEIEENTKACYKKPLSDVKSEFDNDRIRKITPLEIQQYIAQYAKQGRAQQTVKLRLTVLRQIFDYAIIHGDVTISPVSAVKLPKGLNKTKRENPSDMDIKIVKESVNKEFGLFAYLLLYTGLRRGEALALTDNSIDRNNKTIFVNSSIVWVDNKPTIKTPKTNAGVRYVPLLDTLAEKLPDVKGYLFGGKSPLTQKEFRVKWDNYKKETGISFTPHQLRHAYATMLYDADVDSKEAMGLLGHTKESVTRDVYTHIAKTKRDKTAQKINDFLRDSDTVKTQ